jgi:hypothetical protein
VEVIVQYLTFNCFVKNVTEANRTVVPVKYTTEGLVPIAVKGMLADPAPINSAHQQQKTIQPVQLNAQEPPRKAQGVRK